MQRDRYTRIAFDERLPASAHHAGLVRPARPGARERRPVSAIFALGAAFSNALYVATQHVASTSGRVGKASGLRLVAYLMRSPLWLFGWAAAVGAFVFQAAALNNGQLSIVQALLVTELVFGLLLRKLWIGQAIRPAAWGAAALTCVGLAAFVFVDQPQGGTPAPTAQAWAGALATFAGVAALMTLAARRGSPRRRAALYAAAAAIVWALEATFIKTATEILTESGIAAVFTDWPVYALAAGGASGIVLTQAALHVGPLSVSQPLLVIVDPSVSVILSVWLFQERYTRGPAVIVGSVLAFTVMCVGVVALTRTAPSTMRAGPSP
ncbi:MAG TPA: DMT family transporter [Solirubrobacteraceae bacterium]|nr:DMT family transporter [Solirubrobacteraceae bacterium]